MISFSCRMVIRVQKLCSFPVCCSLLKPTRASKLFSPTEPAQRRFITDDIEPIDVVKAAAKKNRVKTPEIPKITLLDSNDNITVTTVTEAEKIAAAKHLRLVRVHDPKLRFVRPVYKLLSEAQYLDEELQVKKKIREEKVKKKTEFIKGEKLMAVSVRISEHDLEVKITKALKWVAKNFEVRMVLSGSADNIAPQEEMYKKIEKAVEGNGRIVQKRVKGGDLKFQIIPPKDESTNITSRKKPAAGKETSEANEVTNGEDKTTIISRSS